MSSRSVVQGDREPVQSRGYAPKSGDDVGVPEHNSTDELAKNDNPQNEDTGTLVRQSARRSGSQTQRVRGSPSPARRNAPRSSQGKPVGFPDVLRQTLKSDEMTSRACRLMITMAVSLAIVLVPIAAVAFLIMIKAPVDWKYILGGGSTVLITLGSWFFGRRRAVRKLKRSPVTTGSEESAEDT
jgi:hypothetical protein